MTCELRIRNSIVRRAKKVKTNGGRKVATSRFSRSSALQCSCRTNDCSCLMISYFRGSFKIKLFAIVKDSRSFDVFDVFLTSAYFFCQIAKFFIGKFAYHTRDKQIELPLRGRLILLLLVWLQTKLDSPQSYYHYLLCTQIIKSDLRSAREIWTALILWKINLRAASRDSIVRRARKWMFLPPTFSLLFSPLKCSFRCMFGKSWSDRIERDST